jgi:hypothetical protein
MAVSFTNNFKNILDKLRDVLRTEFKGALPVYIGHETKDTGTQYLRLDPFGSTLSEYNATSETREFTIDMYYYFSEPNVNKNALDQVLRVTSRIEALIHDNTAMVLTDSSNCFNCRIETTELNALDDENEYVVQLTWVGQHLGNIG